MKKILIALIFLLLAVNGFSAISDLKIPFEVRLGENLTIAGETGVSNQLCKFMVLDSNGFSIERLSDEYTFADGTFYSQRTIQEPPYYRGDDFNVFITCGEHTNSRIFTVLQPVSLAHPVQKSWEYLFDEQNLEAMMILGSLVALVFGSILILVFFKKTGGRYAG